MPQEDNRHKCWKSPIMAHLKAVMGLFFWLSTAQKRRHTSTSIVSLSSLYLSLYLSLYRLSICLSLSLWACVAPPGLYYIWSFIPHLTSLRSVGPKDKSPTQSLRSFVFRWGLTLSSSVTTRDSPSKLGLSSRCSIGSNGRAPLELWIITNSWLSAYHPFLTVTYLQGAEHGHVL